MRKRAQYILKCKELVWKQWSEEYLIALCECHNLKHHQNEMNLQGDIVIIKGDEKNHGQWKLAKVEKSLQGKDGLVRAVRLKSRKSILDRAIQHLYPLDLHCDKIW